ncbi:3'(2'),5'-bisphosphate nucleotidase CysQ [Tahibacter amnicola]|uniref:3'(2'),5'-bisphosphate nucleotidase CysQ n=1 Tax=Tahibacter amnicola TaxID=2976241 RepID=A0ABY6BE83_9GAMM|nr:3'(2'),5'-bisphosphate nucleotidase CysQ [Tahibacter amnicola]UXI67558.1 3'(2'),5'-bisphosphate nucleotidase CysQ [Tahibacter amnicola]
MSAADRESLCRAACDLARTAGAAILEVYHSEFAVTHKDDRSPLTAADLASHRVIVDGLSALTPDLPVLSEESAEIAFEERARWSRYWLVDPLDGTREFIKRNGEFTVNIALIEAHRPVIGIVQAPVTGELWFAWDSGGAFGQATPGGKTVPLRTRACAQPLRVAGSRSHGGEREAELLARLGDIEKFALGSSLKFCRIAEGAADLYLRLGPTSEWDTAAAQCVLEQAGGAVTTLAGESFRYNARSTLLNGDFVAYGDRSVAWPERLGTG